MKPVEFDEQNAVIGKSQSEYQELPAHKDAHGVITTCWEVTEDDLKAIFETGKIYLQQLTFNQPVQPILLSVVKPSL